jgi:hypothetical protein
LETWQPALAVSPSSSSKTRQSPAHSTPNDSADIEQQQQLSTATSTAASQPKPLSTELTTEELIELNNMLNAAIDGGLTDDNMPSPPPEKQGDSSKPTSQKDLQDLHQELDWTKSKLLSVETKFDHLKVMPLSISINYHVAYLFISIGNHSKSAGRVQMYEGAIRGGNGGSTRSRRKVDRGTKAALLLSATQRLWSVGIHAILQG